MKYLYTNFVLQILNNHHNLYIMDLLEKRDVGLMLNRLKRFLKIKSDRELSNYLGLSQNTISMWKQRDSIDYDLILEKCPDISIDYLLSGVKPELISERNRVLNYFQIPILQMDLEKVEPPKTDEILERNTNAKIAELENQINNIYSILSQKLK